MGLFNKYFGEVKNDSNNKKTEDNVALSYIEAVNYIAKIWFSYDPEMIKNCHPEYSFEEEYGDDQKKIEEERLKIDKEILSLFEPKIICTSILGYFLLRNKAADESLPDSLIELFSKDKLFNEMILKQIEPIARQRGDLYFAIDRNSNSGLDFNELRSRMATILRYYFSRFGKYDKHLFYGLDSYLKNSELFDSESFDIAYSHYSNPIETFPDYNFEDSHFNKQDFQYSVYMSYIYLRKVFLSIEMPKIRNAGGDTKIDWEEV